MGVFYEVRQVLGQHGDEDVFFVVVHGFEQELPVVGKEKEGAGFACRLLCFEYLLAVKLSVKTFLDHGGSNIVHSLDHIKNSRCILRNQHFLIHGQRRLTIKILATRLPCLISDLRRPILTFISLSPIPPIDVLDDDLLQRELSVDVLLLAHLLFQVLLARIEHDWRHNIRLDPLFLWCSLVPAEDFDLEALLRLRESRD